MHSEDPTTPNTEAQAPAEIQNLTTSFFSVFSNKDGASVDLAKLYDLCIPEAVIVKTGDAWEHSHLEAFIAPRQKMLEDGTLQDFHEWEVSGDTQIRGKIAQRLSYYGKAGLIQGKPFEIYGHKTFQFVNTEGMWRISAVAWWDLESL